jgi:hypothetical protein
LNELFLCGDRTKRTKALDAVTLDTASETEGDTGGDSVMSPTERYNSKGIRVNSNNVISLRHLALANQVPTKTRDEGSEKCFSASLTLGKAYTLFTLVVNGCKMPVEKQRDSAMRMILLRTVAPYCLDRESMDTILGADPEELNAFLTGLAKNAQQVIKYHMYGIVANFMADKVLTQHDVFPSEAVKMHLGLTGEHATRSFMDMYVYTLILIIAHIPDYGIVLADFLV